MLPWVPLHVRHSWHNCSNFGRPLRLYSEVGRQTHVTPFLVVFRKHPVFVDYIISPSSLRLFIDWLVKVIKNVLPSHAPIFPNGRTGNSPLASSHHRKLFSVLQKLHPELSKESFLVFFRTRASLLGAEHMSDTHFFLKNNIFINCWTFLSPH